MTGAALQQHAASCTYLRLATPLRRGQRVLWVSQHKILQLCTVLDLNQRTLMERCRHTTRPSTHNLHSPRRAWNAPRKALTLLLLMPPVHQAAIRSATPFPPWLLLSSKQGVGTDAEPHEGTPRYLAEAVVPVPVQFLANLLWCHVRSTSLCCFVRHRAHDNSEGFYIFGGHAYTTKPLVFSPNYPLSQRRESQSHQTAVEGKSNSSE